jgi:hypothetical protein
MNSKWATFVLLAVLLCGAVAGTASRWQGNNLVITGAGTNTTCTLNGATPSTCTAASITGSICTCSPVGGTLVIAAGGCAVALAAGTVTVTGPASATYVVDIHCF